MGVGRALVRRAARAPRLRPCPPARTGGRRVRADDPPAGTAPMPPIARAHGGFEKYF